METKFKRETFIVFLSLLLISVIVFAIVSFLNWSLLTGFLIGSIVSFLTYLLNVKYLAHLLSRRRSFKFAFIVGILRALIWLGLIAGVLIGVLFANKNISHSWINGIFNIFTFIYGCVIIPLSLCVVGIIEIFKKRKLKNN